MNNNLLKSAWILTILLLVAPVAITEKDNTITSIGSSTYNYHNYCHRQDSEPLKNSNYFLLSITHILQDFISILLNSTCVYDSSSFSNRFETSDSKHTIIDLRKLQKLLKSKLKNVPAYSERLLIPDSLKDTIDYYINDTIVFNNAFRRSIKRNNKYQRNPIDSKWKRRTLCTISDGENYSAERLFDDKIVGNVDKKEPGQKKTLSDYDGPVLMNDIDDLDSLKAHVRVKRSRSESDPVSSFVHQQDYIKDLANSFPRNSYESIDENSYDDDVSFDAKREIKSQEYFANNEQSNVSPEENDRSKVLNVYPFTVPAYLGDDKSVGSDFISAPSDAGERNTFGNKDVRFVDQTGNQETVSLQEPSNGDVGVINRQSYKNREAQSLPEDPMLAVELVRKKRNDYSKVHDERELENKVSNFQDSNDKIETSPNEEKRSVLESEKFEERLKPSGLVAANLKADLLRVRRKSKGNRHEKKSKLKKKKKHVGKKHNAPSNPIRSIKDVRLKNTDRSRVSRKRKSNDARSEGKSKVGIASVVTKKNNDNNFHRRSVKSKKSIEKRDSEHDCSSKNVASTLRTKLKSIDDDNNIDTDNHKRWLVARKGLVAGSDGYNDLKAESDESTNALVNENRKQAFTEDEKSISLPRDTKLRTKRDKNTESNHGFLSKDEELRYYENIREPGSEMDECSDRDESQFSVGNDVEGNRAVRSIEEVKELAKKLVTKVNELQNYLNVEEAIRDEKREKKIETRAIDDLCSNVSSGCDAFKETPKIVQKCVPVNHDFGSSAKIVERKVDPAGVTDEHRLKVPNKKSAEKKRSVGSRRVVKMTPSTSRTVRKENETKSQRKWGKWTDWSSCSVTCGKGRQIRWRYCLRDCSTAETEMEEKACQLPACLPGKFLGIF